MLKTISETPVTFADAKKMLEAKEAQLHENDKELGHEQRITLEYLRTVPILETKVAEETAKALIEAVDILKEHQVMTLVNILPDCVEDVDLIFAKERIKLDKDQTNKIVDIIKQVKPKKVVKKVVKEVKEKTVAAEETPVEVADDDKKDVATETKKE
ncbi:MAG: hypothetical protein KAI18_01730 [Candidatus Aenigmarchaeota archaeon]|nr:hypothetical protein [Candidatus Aenigmarchaeota archaeon]